MTAEEKAAELYPHATDRCIDTQVCNANKRSGFVQGANWQASQHEWVKWALEELVQLKRWKDKHGKDEHYLKCVDAAWQKAFEAIDNFTKQKP